MVIEDNGEYELICSVLATAIQDSVRCKRPRSSIEMPLNPWTYHRGRRPTREVLACKARKWIMTKNRYFAHYCDLVGWDPIWVRRKCKEAWERVDGL